MTQSTEFSMYYFTELQIFWYSPFHTGRLMHSNNRCCVQAAGWCCFGLQSTDHIVHTNHSTNWNPYQIFKLAKYSIINITKTLSLIQWTIPSSYTVPLWNRLRIYCEVSMADFNAKLITGKALDHISEKWKGK